MGTQTFISTQEAAELAGVTTESIRYLCKTGAITYTRKGNVFSPCKEDIIQYAETIRQVHNTKKDIEELQAELVSAKENLLAKCEDTRQFLESIKQTPYRILKITELLHAILRQYEKNRPDEISERELQLLFMMWHGDTFQKAAEKMDLSNERIRQIWSKLLRKIAAARSGIEERDAKIEKLQQNNITDFSVTVFDKQFKSNDKQGEFLYEELKKEKECNAFILENPEIIKLFRQPVDSLGFSNRAARGLKHLKVNTVYDLLRCNRRDLVALREIGKKTLDEIDQWVKDHGLSYGMQLPEKLYSYLK